MRLRLNLWAVFLVLLLFTGGCGSGSSGKSPFEIFTGGCSGGRPVQAPAASTGGAGKVLFVVAPSDFRDEEYDLPREILEDKGYRVMVASTSRQIVRGTFGLEVKPDLTLSEAKGAEFAAVIFVGGNGAKIYFKDAEAHRLAREACDAGRVVGAICIAPGILAEAGLLEGKQCTAYPSVKELLRAKGAVYSGEEVVVDGRIVTANGPRSARHFGNAVAALLKETGP